MKNAAAVRTDRRTERAAYSEGTLFQKHVCAKGREIAQNVRIRTYMMQWPKEGRDSQPDENDLPPLSEAGNEIVFSDLEWGLES